MVIQRRHIRCALAAFAGGALSTAHPLGIAPAIMAPALALSQETRQDSYATGLSYYGAALWPLIPAARNFFGPDVSALTTVAFWAVSSMLLALPWMLVWSPHHRQALWRAPLGLVLTVVPPLGIIGWASPLTAAGVLFPGTAWLGLAVGAVSGGALVIRPPAAAAVLVMASVTCNLVFSRDARALPGWEAVNTTFGGIAHGSSSPIAEYEAAEWIQRRALASESKVLVFPETAVPTWTPATDEFWQQTLDTLRSSGKLILVGARTARPVPSRSVGSAYDFTADLEALAGAPPKPVQVVHSKAEIKTEAAVGYENGLILRGVQTGFFSQRIPVPLGMWNPLSTATARLNMSGAGIVDVQGQRGAVLICYEQLLTWPLLASMAERPTVLIAVANDYWATDTPIPRFQLTAVRAWARLFRLPYLSAVNR